MNNLFLNIQSVRMRSRVLTGINSRRLYLQQLPGFKDGTVCSYAIVSDDLSHNKYSVWTMLKLLFQELKREFPYLQSVKIFTDGCAAQFKNRFTLLNVTYLQTDFGITGDWNFFASSQGKGAVDGDGYHQNRQQNH